MGAALEVGDCCSWERDVLVGCVECGGEEKWEMGWRGGFCGLGCGVAAVDLRA